MGVGLTWLRRSALVLHGLGKNKREALGYCYLYSNKGNLAMRYPLFLILLFVLVSTVFAEEENSSYPIPTYERVLPNNNILYRRDYRQVIGAIDIHDAPNGNFLRSRPAGTYFATVNAYQDGWAEINTGEWIRAEQLAAAPISSLGGVLLAETETYPLAFLHEMF